MKLLQSIVCFALLLSIAFGFPISNDVRYMNFGSPITTRIPNKLSFKIEPYNLTQVSSKFDLNQVVNIAENAWNFIQANQPTLDVQTNYANAIPSGFTDWTQLENWKDPMSQCFQVDYKNGFGMNVVGFSYCVVYTPGGDYQGKGLYLDHIQIIPSDIQVSWGYKLDAVTSVPSVSNSGSSDNPVASAEVHMKFSVSTALKKDSQEHAYYMKGDGSFMSLN